MAVDGLIATAYIELRANAENLKRDIDEQIAAVGDPAADAMDDAMAKAKQSVSEASDQIVNDLSQAAQDGAAGFAPLRDSVSDAAEGAADDVEGSTGRISKAFEDAAADVGGAFQLPASEARKAIDDASDEIEKRATTISNAFTAAGTGLGDVFEKTGPAIDGAAEDVEEHSSRIGGIFESMSSSIGGALSTVGEKIEGLGLPFGEVFSKAGESMKDTEHEAGSLGDSLASVGKVASIALAGGFVAAGAEGLDMAAKFQDASTTLQAQGNLSASAAKAIGDAFLATGTSAHFSATEITTAYAPIAEQLAGVQGHALSTKQAMDVMSSAMDLADATGDSLAADTKTLGSVMQAYGITAAGAATATNTLYTTSRLTDVPIANIGTAVDKMHLKLGAATPSLSDVGSLMGDLAEHGVVGQRGITTVTTALSGLIDPSTKTAGVLAQLGISLTNSQGKFIGMAPAIADIHDKLDTLPATSNAAAEGLQITADKAKIAALALEPTSAAVTAQKDALGQQVLALTKSSDALTKTSAMTALFGTSASAVSGVIDAGTAGYDKAADAINKTGAVTEAATVRNETFHATMERLEATTEDLGIKFGQILMPILMKLIGVIEEVIDWLTKHKAIAEAVAAVVGGVLVVAIGAFVVSLIAANAALIATTLIAAEILIPLAAIALGVYELYTHWSQVWGDIKTLTMDVVNAVTGAVDGAWQTIETTTTNVFNAVLAFLKQWWPEIFAIFTGGLSLIIGLIIQNWSTIENTTKQVFNAIEGFFVSIWTTIENVFITILNTIHTVIMTVWTAISQFLQTAWTTLESIATTIWNAISNVITAIWQRMVGGLEADWAAVSSFLTGAWSGFESTASNLWTGIVRGITGAWSALTQDAEDLWSGITRAFSDGINDVIGFINRDFLDPLDSVFGHFGVPHLAISAVSAAAGGTIMSPGRVGGGFVTKGPTYLVGEGKRSAPEVVIPTDEAHRDTALKLHAYAGSLMGLEAGGVIGLASGGIIHDITGAAKSVLGDIRSWTADAVDPLINATAATVEGFLSDVPPQFLGQAAADYIASSTKTVEGWLKGHQPAAAATGGGAAGPVSSASNAANQALGMAMAAAYGWTGPEWTALNEVAMRESGWSSTAKNPTSSAYGIAQNIGGLAGYGANGNNPAVQIAWMLNYIAQRYGDPIGAWAHELTAGWYAQGGILGSLPGALPVNVLDSGGFIPQGLSLTGNFTGAPEFVPPPGTATSGSPQINITVIVSTDVTDATIQKLRTEMTDAVADGIGEYVDEVSAARRQFK
jgi:TP901 family phage tail tape measure protein